MARKAKIYGGDMAEKLRTAYKYSYIVKETDTQKQRNSKAKWAEKEYQRQRKKESSFIKKQERARAKAKEWGKTHYVKETAMKSKEGYPYLKYTKAGKKPAQAADVKFGRASGGGKSLSSRTPSFTKAPASMQGKKAVQVMRAAKGGRASNG